MKRIFALTAAFFLSLLWFAAANGGQMVDPSIQKEQNLAADPQQDRLITQPKAGISWREKVVKERYITNQAADRRNALRRSARLAEQERMGEPEQMADTSVESYNAMIRRNNAALKQGRSQRNGNDSQQEMK